MLQLALWCHLHATASNVNSCRHENCYSVVTVVRWIWTLYAPMFYYVFRRSSSWFYKIFFKAEEHCTLPTACRQDLKPVQNSAYWLLRWKPVIRIQCECWCVLILKAVESAWRWRSMLVVDWHSFSAANVISVSCMVSYLYVRVAPPPDRPTGRRRSYCYTALQLKWLISRWVAM